MPNEQPPESPTESAVLRSALEACREALIDCSDFRGWEGEGSKLVDAIGLAGHALNFTPDERKTDG